jgi:hypothetical protein
MPPTRAPASEKRQDRDQLTWIPSENYVTKAYEEGQSRNKGGRNVVSGRRGD